MQVCYGMEIHICSQKASSFPHTTFPAPSHLQTFAQAANLDLPTEMPSSPIFTGRHLNHPSRMPSLPLLNPHALLQFAGDSCYVLVDIYLSAYLSYKLPFLGTEIHSRPAQCTQYTVVELKQQVKGKRFQICKGLFSLKFDLFSL